MNLSERLGYSPPPRERPSCPACGGWRRWHARDGVICRNAECDVPRTRCPVCKLDTEVTR